MIHPKCAYALQEAERNDGVTYIYADANRIDVSSGFGAYIGGGFEWAMMSSLFKLFGEIAYRFAEVEAKRIDDIEAEMENNQENSACALCGYTAVDRFVGDICPKCGLTYWKRGMRCRYKTFGKISCDGLRYKENEIFSLKNKNYHVAIYRHDTRIEFYSLERIRVYLPVPFLFLRRSEISQQIV